jgi:hypothetical protein
MYNETSMNLSMITTSKNEAYLWAFTVYRANLTHA